MTPTDQMLNLILKKLDRVDERLDNQGRTLSAQHETLKEHMRRTEANEESVAVLSAAFAPVKQHVVLVGAAGKAIVFLGGAAVAVLGLLKTLGVL